MPKRRLNSYERRIAVERIRILERMKKIKPEYGELYENLIEKIKKRAGLKFR